MDLQTKQSEKKYEGKILKTTTKKVLCKRSNDGNVQGICISPESWSATRFV